MLAAKGMVDARPKRGTFVRPRSAWSLLDGDWLPLRDLGTLELVRRSHNPVRHPAFVGKFVQMRGQRQSGMAVLVAFGSQILMGGISAVILFTGNWTGNPWLPAEAFIFLAAAAVGGYFASLDALSSLAEEKKEVLIEALCR